MRTVTWYFDFISPYAYFGLHTLRCLPADAAVHYQPVLFAGLLNHWWSGPGGSSPQTYLDAPIVHLVGETE
jgi:2-hydroxychromene-2-carboxylate isomerase